MAAAFFEKIGSMAKNVTDKASDALEINRINAKINGEKNKISTLKFQLGEFFWTKFDAGETADLSAVEAADLCTQIISCNQSIADCEKEIQEIREAQQAAAAQAAAQAQMQQAAQYPCPSCGNAVTPNLKFCPKCGTKLEPPAPALPSQKLCPSCGAALADGQKFCGVCGARATE